MITILSQNKDKICDCKILVSEPKSYSSRNGESKEYAILGRDGEGLTFLGEYATEERAKEVVSEIFGMIKCGSYTSKISDNESYTNQLWYEMPKE